MNDGLDVKKFNNTNNKEVVTVRVKNVSPKVYKKKLNYKVVKRRIEIAIVGLAVTAGLAAATTARFGEDTVTHKGDTVSAKGEVAHWHELTKEDFMRDFLYLNPGASDEDIIEALQNGEYEYYMENNGAVKLHPNLTVFQFGVNSPKEYDEKIVPHVDELMEEYNIEESHGKTK